MHSKKSENWISVKLRISKWGDDCAWPKYICICVTLKLQWGKTKMEKKLPRYCPLSRLRFCCCVFSHWNKRFLFFCRNTKMLVKVHKKSGFKEPEELPLKCFFYTIRGFYRMLLYKTLDKTEGREKKQEQIRILFGIYKLYLKYVQFIHWLNCNQTLDKSQYSNNLNEHATKIHRRRPNMNEMHVNVVCCVLCVRMFSHSHHFIYVLPKIWLAHRQIMRNVQ